MMNVKRVMSSLVLLLCVSLSILTVSCDKDDSTSEVISATDVRGNYEGTLDIVAIPHPAPTAEGDEQPKPIVAKAVVTETEVVFEKFPANDVLAAIIAQGIAPAGATVVGDVTYKLPYAAKLAEDYKTIELTFTPAALELEVAELPVVNPTEGEKPENLKVTVTFSTPDKGVFTYEGATFDLGLTIDKITVDGTDVPFASTLKFNLVKQK